MKWKLGHYSTSNPPTVIHLYLFWESKKGTLTQCTQCWMLRKCQWNSRDCGAVDKNLGNELKIYFLALSKTTPDVLSSFFPHMSMSSNVVLNPWSYIPDVSNFYSPLISQLEPEPPPLIRTKWRRRGRETQERRKGVYARGIKQNETSFLQSRHYERQRWNMISGAASSSVHWFVIAHCRVLWTLPDEH